MPDENSKKRLTVRNTLIFTTIFIVLSLVVLPFVIYLKVLPQVVSSPKVINYVEKFVAKNFDADLKIEKPYLHTNLSPEIVFKLGKITVSKNNKELFFIDKVYLNLSFEKIFEKKIVIKDYSTNSLFADVNGLMTLSPKQSQEQQKNDWTIEWLDSRFYLGKALILYSPSSDTHLKVSAKNVEIVASRKPKFVHFDVNMLLTKGKHKINLTLDDKNKVFMKNKKLYLDNFYFIVNNSKVFVRSEADENNKFKLVLFANKFDISNIITVLESNLIIPNGKEMLIFTQNIKGTFDFIFNLTEKDYNGLINFENIKFNAVPLANLPITADNGTVSIDKNKINFNNINGYYGSNAKNTIDFKGDVTDYMKSVTMDLKIKTTVTNEFMKNYLTKIIGCPVSLEGNSHALLKISSKNNKYDIKGLFKIKKGDNIMVSGTSLSPKGYETALKTNMHFEGNELNIKSIDYLIAEQINRTHRPKPLLSIYGDVIVDKIPFIKKIGFEIPNPLPSEFLNMISAQQLFKKGTISGKLEYDNSGKTPILNGNAEFKDVRVKGQRLSIKNGKLKTDNKIIYISANGRFRKHDYNFSGNIVNEMLLPVIVKDVDLTMKNLDVEKVMASFSRQAEKEAAKKAELAKTQPQQLKEDDENDNEPYIFVPNLLVIEKCMFNVEKGAYKQINFGNLHANLTLTKNGILQIQSNKFDFAEGISTLKVFCDLVKHNYSIRLGAKDVNSDVIATSILALQKEISGKASALLEFNTDDSAKLNGSIKFIINNGTIGKLGYVEYLLKFVSIFRNPIVMISPSTVVDMVNIPEGTFNNISGIIKIKNNIVDRINIKSSSPQLSSFITGRFDLGSRDASLRIYTKFSSKNKGFAGFLRNLSLNSLARKVSFTGRNESNYYSAELSQLPKLETEAEEKDSQVFLTKVEGDVEHNNFLSSLKRIK